MAAVSKTSKRKGGGDHKSFSKKPKTGNEKSSTSQKRALKHERQSTRKHADTVVEAKDIWNKLRLKNNTPEQVHELTANLMNLIRGKMKEIVLQHDASRVVQAAIQFGTPADRREVVMELCANKGDIAELSKVQYAHFAVLKMIKYCHRDAECVKTIVKALKGSIPKLAVHAVGARVVELLFSTFPPKSTVALKQEFYGPHFSLFASNDGPATLTPTLMSNLEQAPEKKAVTLEFVVSILNKGMEKGLFGFVYLQQLFSEYVQVASGAEVRAICSAVADQSIHMLSTRAGTRVVASCATYGTAKDRKRIMKSLKGYSRSSLTHRDAYVAILRLVQVTDDTVSIYKSVLAELLANPDDEEDDDKSPLLDLALDENASKLFLLLLVPKDNEARLLKYFDPWEREIMEANPTVMENGVEVPISKKNPETRRKELLQHLQKPLIEMCAKHADVLVRSMAGARVMREVYAAFHPQDMVDSVVTVCKQAVEIEEEKPLFEDPVGHLAIKNLVLCDAEAECSSPLFAEAFVTSLKGKLAKVGKSNRGCFVLTALCKVPTVRESARKELQKHNAQRKKLSKEKGRATAGYNALLKELAQKATG